MRLCLVGNMSALYPYSYGLISVMVMMKMVATAALICTIGAGAQASLVNNGSFDLTAAEEATLNGSGWGLFDTIDGWAAETTITGDTTCAACALAHRV